VQHRLPRRVGEFGQRPPFGHLARRVLDAPGRPFDVSVTTPVAVVRRGGFLPDEPASFEQPLRERPLRRGSGIGRRDPLRREAAAAELPARRLDAVAPTSHVDPAGARRHALDVRGLVRVDGDRAATATNLLAFLAGLVVMYLTDLLVAI
jgi:hypothetical protein